jgi:hypothetical protein
MLKKRGSCLHQTNVVFCYKEALAYKEIEDLEYGSA